MPKNLNDKSPKQRKLSDKVLKQIFLEHQKVIPQTDAQKRSMIRFKERLTSTYYGPL